MDEIDEQNVPDEELLVTPFNRLYDELPKDVLFEIALHMNGPTLRNFCRSNQRASRICSDPYFRDSWIKYNDKLTFKQRQDIDNIIDDMVDTIIRSNHFYVDKTDLYRIKKDIRENFRAIIGRDLRQLIYALMNFFIEEVKLVRARINSPTVRTSSFDYYFDNFFDQKEIYDIFRKHFPVIEEEYLYSIVIDSIYDILKILGIPILAFYPKRNNFDLLAESIHP